MLLKNLNATRVLIRKQNSASVRIATAKDLQTFGDVEMTNTADGEWSAGSSDPKSKFGTILATVPS